MYAPVGRIQPVAPSPSLLTSARPLPGDVDWRSGIAWSPICQPSYAYQLCPPAVNRTDADDRSQVHTVPFVVYTPQSCEGITSFSEPIRGDVEQAVRDLTEVHTASAIAAALWMGTGLPTADLTIPTLRRSAIDVTDPAAGDPADIDDGVALLLAYYEDATGGNGGATIHVPSHLMTSMLGGVPGGARVAWPEGNIYRGPLGSVVSPGPGYPLGGSPNGPQGHGPLTVAGPPEQYAGNAPGHAWIYVTGPVEYAVTPVRAIPEDEVDRVPFRTNIYEVWGERDAIVRFDPCSAFAVKVNATVAMQELS